MSEKVLMKDNQALRKAPSRRMVSSFGGHPITPQTELGNMAKRMPKEGGTYLQAESEVAAINMVYGASAAGARVHDLGFSPGSRSLNEGISYMDRRRSSRRHH